MSTTVQFAPVPMQAGWEMPGIVWILEDLLG
jgi:hypothetical protein